MPQLLNEAELEEYLFGVLSEYGIISEEICGTPFRQVTFKGYGTADLIVLSTDLGLSAPKLIISIIELKKNEIDLTAVGQICRYRKAILRLIEKNQRIHRHFEDIDIRGYLIGSVLGSGDVCYLIESIEWLTTIIYSISLETGLELQTVLNGWHAPDEDFLDIEARFIGYVHKQIIPSYHSLLRKIKEEQEIRHK